MNGSTITEPASEKRNCFNCYALSLPASSLKHHNLLNYLVEKVREKEFFFKKTKNCNKCTLQAILNIISNWGKRKEKLFTTEFCAMLECRWCELNWSVCVWQLNASNLCKRTIQDVTSWIWKSVIVSFTIIVTLDSHWTDSHFPFRFALRVMWNLWTRMEISKWINSMEDYIATILFYLFMN